MENPASCQPVRVAVERLCIANAGDPGKQTVEARKRRSGAREIADADSARRFEDTSKLPRGSRFVRKGAEGTLAENGVEERVCERQALCVTELERYQRFQLAGAGFAARLVNICFAEVDADHAAAKLLGQQERARALPGRNIEHHRTGSQMEMAREFEGQLCPAGMEAFAQQKLRRIAAVDVRAALLDGGIRKLRRGVRHASTTG